MDYQLGANHSVFGRYMASRDKKPSAFGTTGNVLTTANPSIDNLAQSLTLGDTKVFGSNTVNALRFAFNRTAVDRDNDPYFDPPSLGIKAYTYVPGSMIVVVTGGFNIAAATATRGIADNNSFQVNDDLTVVRGNHQLGARRQRRALQGVVQDVGARRRTVELHRHRHRDWDWRTCCWDASPRSISPGCPASIITSGTRASMRRTRGARRAA